MKLDGFLLSMLGAVILALVWPELGGSHSPLHIATLTQWGIALVFWLHGVMLPPDAVRRGATKWRLHLLVQATTFVLFPLLGLLIYGVTQGWLNDDLRIGLFLLCAMSSTISSSVAMTAMAKGDVASAVFNASASGLIGMVLTPLWMQCINLHATHGLPLSAAITSIALTLALPFALGQLLRPWLIERLLPHKPWINRIDRGVIVLIVFQSFCESTLSGVWQQFAATQLLGTLMLVALLLASMLFITRFMARRLAFNREEEITALFCGSKKSLANGAPIAKILFAGHPGLGLILLPLMLYHQLQLLVCTVLARKYARPASSAIQPTTQNG